MSRLVTKPTKWHMRTAKTQISLGIWVFAGRKCHFVCLVMRRLKCILLTTVNRPGTQLNLQNVMLTRRRLRSAYTFSLIRVTPWVAKEKLHADGTGLIKLCRDTGGSVSSLYYNTRVVREFLRQSSFCQKDWTLFNTTYIVIKCYIIYRKFPKYWDTKKIRFNHSKIWTMWLYHREMSPNDADGMANSADPDQTAPLWAVWSGSALLAQAYRYLSENLGSLRYN